MPLSKESKAALQIFTESRLIILQALYNCRQNVCGCDLVDQVKMAKNLVSYHLSLLKKLGYVEEIRCGQKKQYQIVPDKQEEVGTILKLLKLL